MSRRIGSMVSYGARVGGKVSTVAMITADVRTFWPPSASESDVIAALDKAIVLAMQDIRRKFTESETE